MNNINFSPAYILAKGIRDGEFTSEDVVKSHLENIKTYNSALNAIVTLNTNAIAQARAADEVAKKGEVLGPLHGVPVTLKDLFETEGILTTFSNELAKNYIPKHDAPIVSRLKAAGAIIIGKTNMPKNGADFQTNSPLFGKTNNPWNLEYTSGGSTGGGAAAVAAGMSPLEFGNDLGGSLRIPAHFCGVFSLKPSEYRVSDSLRYNTRYLRCMMATGPIARCVEDLEIGLRVIEGLDQKEWEVPPRIVEETVELSLSNCRIAWCDSFADLATDTETKKVLNSFVKKLQALGITVHKCLPKDFDFEEAWYTFGELFACQTSFISNSIIRQSLKAFVTVLPKTFIPGGPIEEGFLKGLTIDYKSYIESLSRRERLISNMQTFMADWDGWICPVAPSHAFTHRPTNTFLRKDLEVDEQKLSYLSWGVGFNSILSITGNPVVTIPIGFSSKGLPIGIQLAGKRWKDNQLIKLAKFIEHSVGGYEKPQLRF